MDEEELLQDAQRRLEVLEAHIHRLGTQGAQSGAGGRQPRPEVVWEGQPGTLGAFIKNIGQRVRGPQGETP